MTTITTTTTQPQNDVVVGFRLWTASFRRKLLSTVTCGGGVDRPENPTTTTKPGSDPLPVRAGSGRPRSERLGDLLNLTKEEVGAEAMALAVKRLNSGIMAERVDGAEMVRRLAKEDCGARSTLAMLGAIPPLIAMIDDQNTIDVEYENPGIKDSKDGVVEVLYALLNLCIGNDLNKAAIVQAGAVHKMINKISSSNGSLEFAVLEAIVANLLALSALDSNKPILGSLGSIPFLVEIIKNPNSQCTSQAKQDALKALYNLSISSLNIPFILKTDLTHYLINALGNMEVSERLLSILSNIVSTSEGRKSISQVPDAFPTLIDVLNWTDSPGCQEKASYVLMVIAHKSYNDRQRMIEAGISSTLLELTLLGSTLAQKRASRILECLRIDKGKQTMKKSEAVSAPICGHSIRSSNFNKEEEGMMSEEKKAVKKLVEQSLENNLRRIVKRANLAQDFVPSEHLKSLTGSSTSKSLPF